MISLAVLLLAIAQCVFLLFGVYLLFLTMAGVGYRTRPPARSSPKTRFAVLIPAHNEEHQLPTLLESLLDTGYPKELLGIYVVADNCSDGTAEVARRFGAETFQRHDQAKKGKGYALHWLWQQVSMADTDVDAYLCIDADCHVFQNFLHTMDEQFQNGARVVQGYYAVADPFRSDVSSLRFIAMALKHFVRPLGRSRLKLSCGLFGTGMGFDRNVLSGTGWEAFTLAEDIEYYLQLTRLGIPVTFAPNAIVSSPMPNTLGDSRSQNLRWEKGRLQMLCKHGPGLLLKGVLQGDFRKIDAVIEQAIPPLSVTFTVVFALLPATWFTSPTWLFALSVVTVAAYCGHVFIGLALAGVPLRAYRSLTHVPRYILWKLLLYAQALLPGRHQWVRTRR